MPVTIDTIEQYFTGTWIASHITEAMAMPFPRSIPKDQEDPLKGYRKPEPSKKTAKKAAKKKAKKASRR